MEIPAMAEMALTNKRAEFSMEMNVLMMKQALAQDASVLQIVAAVAQAPSAAPSVPPGGVGSLLNITA